MGFEQRRISGSSQLLRSEDEQVAEEYLSLRQIDQTPPRVALNIFISLAGDRDVGEYSREDAKLFVRHLTLRGNV